MSDFGTLDLEEMLGEDTRLNETGQASFLEQFVPMPEVKPGQTGTVSVRILPPVRGGKLYQYNRTHKMNGRSIHCPRPLVNGKWERSIACPICDYYSGLWAQADKLEKSGAVNEANKLKAEARLIKPVERYYYNAIVRSMPGESGAVLTNVGPRILSVGVTLHKQLIRAIVGEQGDPDSKLGNFTDLKNGYDFIIRKEITSGDGFPKYERSGFARSTSPAGTPEEVKKWAETLHDLTKLRNPKDLDYLEKELAIHRGLIPDDVEKFDTNSFDAKWGKKAQDEVKELMEHKTGGVSVPVSLKSETASVTTTEASVAAKSEDIPIEDEDFLNALQEMEGK
jgi:hypothetical protein